MAKDLMEKVVLVTTIWMFWPEAIFTEILMVYNCGLYD